MRCALLVGFLNLRSDMIRLDRRWLIDWLEANGEALSAFHRISEFKGQID